MTARPTPDEARQALHSIDDGRDDAARAAAWPRAWWIGAGVFLIAYGLLVDVCPDFFADWGVIIVSVLLALTALGSTRWGRTVTGRRARPRNVTGPGRWIFAVVGALVIVALTLLSSGRDVPHLSSIIGIAGGLLLAVGGPWWEARALRRRAELP